MDTHFLHDILNHPEDDVPRLVYADWLEENGDGRRAEFIRVQCELAAGTPDDDADRRDDLMERQDELLLENGDRWTAAIDAFTIKSVFNRGLIEFVTMKAEDFLTHGEELYQVGPVHSIALSFSSKTTCHPELAAWPLFAKIRGLCLSGNLKSGSAVLNSPHLHNVEKLVVSEASLNNDFLQAIADSPSLNGLKMLDLSRNRIRNAGVNALAQSANVSGVEVLLLRENEIRLLGAKGLASSDRLQNVRYLDVRSNPIPRRGIDLLRERFGHQAVEV